MHRHFKFFFMNTALRHLLKSNQNNAKVILVVLNWRLSQLER